MYVQRNIEARSCNHCGCGKGISIIYSECVFVVLGYPEFNVSSVACPALQFFPQYLMKEMIFEKQLLNIKCVF